MASEKKRYRGPFAQLPIYLGKCFRMFIYQSDWKFLPMTALIAGVVALVVGGNMFFTMEGAFQGSFALDCVCIWIGFFNSIQSICRERPIIKREHRSGMYISTYLIAHMIYQLILCVLETVIILAVYRIAGVKFYTEGFMTPWFLADLGITLFLIIYASDMTSLFVSCLVRSTTTAMTVMPFLLMFELVFSGGAFELGGISKALSTFTISKYGLNCIAAHCNYNELRSVTLWNTFFKLRTNPYVNQVILYLEENNKVDDILVESSKSMQVADYARTTTNICNCWIALLIFTVVFAALSIFSLSFVDRDKR